MPKSPVTAKAGAIKGPYVHLCRLWICRLFHEGVIDSSNPPEFIRRLIKTLFGENADTDKPEEFQNLVAFQLESIEKTSPILDGVLATNLALLGKHFALNVVEREILAFRAAFRLNPQLKKVLTLPFAGHEWTDHVVSEVLSVALKRPNSSINKALHHRGRLNETGLLNVTTGAVDTFESKLTVMHGIVTAISRPATSVYDLLSYAITKLPPAKLTIENYPHHLQDVELIQCHLKESLKSHAKGVNILLHGSPGVGKTELVRMLATQLKLNAFEVTQLNRGEENAGYVHPRFRAYCMLQKLLGKMQKGLVLFDELEDVLPKPNPIGSDGPGKAWFNKILEENQVPTIWVSNHVWQIDPAYMRRFDIVLEVCIPPRSIRKKILNEKLNGLPVDEKWVDSKASDKSITPAMAERITNVIRSARITERMQVQLTFDRMMKEHQNALGENNAGSYPTPNEYRLDWLNTSTDMELLSQGMAHSGKGRILLYGPPGCGKTAFAHHLAKTIDRPLMLKRASDIMSMWVGGTERNLREMFREAAHDNALLLLDEADSFLQDRRSAQHSWELTQVNELLTQMENYQGVFICATNFMEHLDTAAMRRFSFKIKFDYLRPEQAENLFLQLHKRLHGKQPDDLTTYRLRQELGSLKNLTPGDFSAIHEQFELLGTQPSIDELLEEICQSSEIKAGGRKVTMGFAA